MWSFPLLPSAALKQVCLCVRQRERWNQRNKKGTRRENTGTRTSLRGEKKNRLGCVVLSPLPVKQHTLTGSVTHTHVDNCCVCFQSDLRGGVCCRLARGHTTRISCSVLLKSEAASSVHTSVLLISMNHDELCQKERPERKPVLLHLASCCLHSFPTDLKPSASKSQYILNKPWCYY